MNLFSCFQKPSGNCHVALNGDSFFLSFNLPFTDFLPSTVDVGIEIEVSTSNEIIISLKIFFQG